MLKILNKKFPVFIPNRVKWIITIVIALFIFFFMSIFKPFDIEERAIYPMYIVGSCLGMVSFVCGTLYFFFFRTWVAVKWVREENWRLWHELVLIVVLLVCISIGNHFVTLFIIKESALIANGDLLNFLTTTYYTVMIGLIPSIVVVIYLESKEREFYQTMSAGLNPGTRGGFVKSAEVSVVSGTEELKFKSSDLIYIKAEGNYLDFYLENETQVEKHVVRNTLSNIAEILQQEKTNCLRTHRSYLVNLDKIESVKGNSQGYVLTLKNHEQVIPVSRKSIPEFNRVMNDNN